jgi:hypothetical protein
MVMDTFRSTFQSATSVPEKYKTGYIRPLSPASTENTKVFIIQQRSGLWSDFPRRCTSLKHFDIDIDRDLSLFSPRISTELPRNGSVRRDEGSEVRRALR